MGLPTGIPLSQYYGGFAEINYNQIDIRLTSWCNHWLSQSREHPEKDKDGVELKVRYNF